MPKLASIYEIQIKIFQYFVFSANFKFTTNITEVNKLIFINQKSAVYPFFNNIQSTLVKENIFIIKQTAP